MEGAAVAAAEASGGLMTPNATVLTAVLAAAAGAYFVLFRGGGNDGKSAAEQSSVFAAYKKQQAGGGKSAEEKEVNENTVSLGPMTVFFGSQTGTAEECAGTLVEEGKKRGFDAKSVDLEDFEPEMLTENVKGLHVFCLATYGEGDPTDNAISFFKWLKKEVEELPQALDFSVFGLGNSQYEHFNSMGRSVNKILEERGAQRAYDYGEGDDDGTLEEDFEKWCDGFWPAVVRKYGGDEAVAASSQSMSSLPSSWKPTHKVVWMVDPGEKRSPEEVEAIAEKARDVMIKRVVDGLAKNDPDHSVTRSSLHYFLAKEVPVASQTELRPDNGTESDADGEYGSTVHVEFDLARANMSYGTADNLAICCSNDPDLVETLAKWQDYDLDRYFLHLRNDAIGSRDASVNPLFPSPCTVRQALSLYCDLASPVRKAMLPKLALYVEDEKQRQELLHLASPDGREKFANWVHTPGRTVVEVMEAFPSMKVPFEAFLEIVPRLMSRDYTISSSAAVSPDFCSVTCKVVRERKARDPSTSKDERRMHFGVCSNFLHRESKSARVFVRTSTFNLPKDPSVPIIMVGPGTGIAPMRAFLQERRHQRKTLGNDRVGASILYFGCRRSQEDYIYHEELDGFVQDGTLTDLQVAFSREGKKKEYVQDLMLKSDQAQRICDLIVNNGAHFYVCGGTKMGNQVKKTLENIISSSGNMEAQAATAYVKAMQDTVPQRYVQELWS